MKASALIKELQNLIAAHGDQPVKFDGRSGDVPVGEIIAYDQNGNDPSVESPAAEFYIHQGPRLSTPHTPTGE
ncbi:hypothetical protein FHW77_002915 [Agrobacterium sp. RC10-4-1]|uniref:hypothetical protein n=1 Tax=Agrobacterium sp. RC10-4-1 TaxID=2587039 RepID=UPI0015FC2B4F|nr:hypothetical protein [Agrobacterium sp. RC10-4-1]MBA8799196.1 hypothetical protein [Agrobacterium sp. RC10-4-1]